MKTAFKVCVVTLTCAVAAQAQDNAARPPEGFTALFDGKSLNGWKASVDPTRWVVENGAIICKRGSSDGFLRTTQEYGDFELRFEYRWERGNGNSGVAIRTAEKGQPLIVGMEIEIIDDEGARGKLASQHTGAVYEVIPAKEATNNKIGEWNAMRIMAKGRKLIVEQNEKVLVDANLNDHEKAAESRPGLKREKGLIGFQGYLGRIEFRNVFIKDLSRAKEREQEMGPRAAVPNDAAVAKAETAIRQVFKNDYTKKTPAELKALAQKLMQLATETNDDPAARYVLLRDARDFAQSAADTTLTLQAIDALSRAFQINGPAEQLASLEKILTVTTAAATAKTIADAATAASQIASDGDEFDTAVEFAQLALNAAKKAKFTAAAFDEADSNLALAKKARDAFAALRPALEKLKITPDDPTANTLIGKYRFNQGRWDEGLKHLSKSEDAALRLVVDQDLKTPRTGVLEDTNLADAWWEYAQVAPADVRWAAQVRTRYWYGRTIPGLTGLPKVRAEGRLAITSAGIDYRPGLLCEFTTKQASVLKGKKARLDSAINFSGGEFADGTKQTDLVVKWTGGFAPPRTGRYTLVAQTTDPVRVKIDGKIVIDTTVGGTPKREASVTLSERVTPFVVELFTPNTDRHKLKLAWIVPGITAEEPIPAEYLFHDKKAEIVLGK